MQPELIGYADRFSAAAGESLRFMVSTDAPTYEVAIVRLIHPDPAAPDVKHIVMESPASRPYRGRRQVIYPGSFVLVEHQQVLDQLHNFTLQAWIYPTTPDKGQPQGVLTKWSEREATGFGLLVGEGGHLGLWTGSGGRVAHHYTDQPMRAREWYFVAASFDADSGEARLYQFNTSNFPGDPSSTMFVSAAVTPSPSEAPLLIAAEYGETVRPGYIAGRGVFNGKIDRPRLFSRALNTDEIDQLRTSAPPEGVAAGDLVAAWDFSDDIASSRIRDSGPNQLHGIAVNMPCRAATGHNWMGTEVDFRRAPSEYAAIHFHDDDLDDARWEVDLDLTVPAEWQSGIYAAKLTAGNQVDYIPFCVRPRKGKPTAQAAFLIPTMTYLAYANFRGKDTSRDETGALRQPLSQPLDEYLAEHPELAMSIYDHHSDGSGCCFSTRLRPIPNMRPHYRWGLVGGPRHFSADLYMVDWLEAKGFANDVFTDEDLHFDGLELLANYRVLITGTHPEYWTKPMMDALQAYLGAGGRLMYLGGNGFYWVTSVDPERPHVVEVRRGIAGTRTWESAPGECYHSTTGEPGGLWRHRGRAPNAIAGVGFTAQGWDGRAPGYTRKPDSFDARAAFIFEGIGPDEVIGDFGLGLGGAAGDELDRIDYRLGTPYHTLVLASSSGHSKGVLPVIEDHTAIDVKLVSGENWNVQADMVFFETANGGAVFSTGSIAWCSALSHNNYTNNVSRITENVLRRFVR